ncbi:MAG TPA: non-ribosomal peptide synthetase, partial [Ornithinimicrobium sp.]|uniref:non-ribosomal peptide synthetase n=1 Tax=Ornithinimicrobium sp. TaxID=1977084 RepID=UPI002B49A52F
MADSPPAAGSRRHRVRPVGHRSQPRPPRGSARRQYDDLDVRANRLANHLLHAGLRTGSRVGVFIERSLDLYVGLLAAMKSSATFVPIDPAAPADRVAYIATDSDLSAIITTSALAEQCAEAPVWVVPVDTFAAQIAESPRGRPHVDVEGDPICYILYTSGSTGRPKGVEIAQSSIVNFISIVPELYGVTPSERVYQGMVAAFDFSFEEIWPTWATGATLVAGPTDGRRVGPGLAQFLEESAVTMIYCVPTVLATLDRTIPSIRTVNVGGEACPAELVTRWGQSGRRILNTYGPTETTITCTMAELYSGKPVTIGHPLPTYSITLLDDDLQEVAHGEVGEICVGGPGVARGYVNRPEQTADRFIPDPAGGESRIYRTGDLGRILDDGQIEYLGRADSEVKVRGHRVDLGEIESVLLQNEAVSGAVVNLHQAPGATDELVAYVVLAQPERRYEKGLAQRLHARAQSRLPAYMVPTFLEWIDALPMMPSGKVDRNRLPEPQGSRLVGGSGEYVAPRSETERRLAAVWEGVLGLPAGHASVEADLLEDLGGHSLVAATLISRLRATGYEGTEGLSVLDVYAHPTVRALAQAVDERVMESNLQPTTDTSASAAPSPRRVPGGLSIASRLLPCATL